MNFNDVDITLFVKFISELTGRNFIIDNQVKGRITVISPEKITVSEAYRVFESVLETSGFTTVPAGKVIKIVPSPEARSKSVPTRTGASVGAGSDRLVTQVISLRYADPVEVQKLLQPLVSKNSVIAAYAPTNTLIVTDFQSNIARLQQILKTIDVEGSDQQIAVIPVVHADAVKLAKNLTTIFGTSTARGRKRGASTPDEPLKFVADERSNSIVMLGDPQQIAQVRQVIGELDQEVPRDEGNIRVIYLKNAKAEDLAKVLQSIPTQQTGKPADAKAQVLSTGVQIMADKATNSLLITADKDDFPVLEEIIAKLDIPRSMVYIEGLIMEVSTGKQFDLGVTWQVAGETRIGPRDGAVAGGYSGRESGTAAPWAGNFSTGKQQPGFSLGVFSDLITIGGVSFPGLSAVISAYKQDDDINIISAPQVMTTDNEEAKIVVGKNVPFQTQASTSNNDTFNSFEYRDVGTTLKITPQISQDRMVRLNIFQEITKVESITDARPTTLKRSVETTVMVRDGNTVVIGGLIDDSFTKTRYKTPILGDIPLLGWFFRSKSDSAEKTNLYVFITPRVVQSTAEAEALLKRKRHSLQQPGSDDEIIQQFRSVPQAPPHKPSSAPSTPDYQSLESEFQKG